MRENFKRTVRSLGHRSLGHIGLGVLSMSMPVVDGPMRTQGTLHDFMTHGTLKRMADGAGMKIPPLSLVSETTPLLTRVNHNRWIVDCPDCGGAEFLFPEGLFMCANCWNGAVGHRWRRVKLPKNRDDIEDALTVRPVPSNRNWEPHETVAQLQAENEAKGLPTGQAVLRLLVKSSGR